MFKGKSFAGANVFMSRNLVPPEVFEALLDALKLNGADVFLCCDPSRNGPNDYHVISSPDHEKFKDLRAKGCHLLGPQCVLSCAKERRLLPKKEFACCLAMDEAKVLVSGFDMEEKEKIENMVKRMGGVLLTKTSSDVNFVIVKNVLAAKYKWALNVLKKPIVTLSWLHQCWNEHRVVPQEPYRVLPFSGLTISVTKIDPDERKDIEKTIIQNGGKYSPELTKLCTHLIAKAPEGDKYKVARRWGHIHIVSRRWFDSSICRRACLDEESYPVLSVPLNSSKMTGVSSFPNHAQDKSSKKLQRAATSSTTSFTGCEYSDLEATLSQNMNSILSDPYRFTQETHKEAHDIQSINVINAVGNESQSEVNIEYLSKCVIALVGFKQSEMQELVNIIRRGGGTQRSLATSFLTHIVVGSPSETEKKDIRNIAALGVIDVAKACWLEDCDQAKRAVDVLRQHAAYELLIPKDSAYVMNGLANLNVADQKVGSAAINFEPVVRSESFEHARLSACEEIVGNVDTGSHIRFMPKEIGKIVSSNSAGENGARTSSKDLTVGVVKPSTVFKGKTFLFSESFPEDRRPEIVEWISQGGGSILSDCSREFGQFTIVCHGLETQSMRSLQTTYVSSHWIKSCLEVGILLEVSSHILYAPLPCNVPLPGFAKLRFCISQYDEKERSLTRNLCFVLGAKLVEKLTKKVTHLLCKFSVGPKFEAACKWGICTVTCDWIYECIRQNNVVAMDLFHPKEVTAQDREAQFCTVSQFPIPSAQTVAEKEDKADVTIRSYCSKMKMNSNGFHDLKEESQRKKSRFLKEFGSGEVGVGSAKYDGESTRDGADVSASIEVIEGLYELAHDMGSIGGTTCAKNIFPPECSVDNVGSRGSFDENKVASRPAIVLSKLWENRTSNTDNLSNHSNFAQEDAYNCSETQTDSQVVGYEEDLSGRQMLIDKIRLRTSFS